TLCAYQEEERLVFDLLYNPNVYAREEIQSILARIEKVLQAIGENPNRKLSEIETITEQEKFQILSGFNDTAV
ncbi:condensation domain-containing protein, partial [Paenibacillus camerounensis]|uniref:condensation domain-containing protein n=1 Tax=Paenibacillus camerounensis TaxID=1243663 RepID=UPI0005AA0C5A